MRGSIQGSSSSLSIYLHNNPHRVFILDGGTGEELFLRGVPDDRKLWSATALVHAEHHTTLQNVHQSFLKAGADAITTNSYGCVPGVGFDESEMTRLCKVAATIARHAATEHETASSNQVTTNPSQKQPTALLQAQSSHPVFVLGSLGPLVESYRADLVLPHDQGVAFYKLMIQAMLPFVDAFILETMSSVTESFQAIDALLSVAPQMSCLVSFSLQPNGRLWSDDAAPQAVHRLVAHCHHQNISLLGILFNCATPEAITSALMDIRRDDVACELLAAHHIRLGAYANKLTPVPAHWSLADSDGPQPMRTDLDANQYYHDFVRHWIEDLGVGIVGGCCGITPEHIAVLKESLRKEVREG